MSYLIELQPTDSTLIELIEYWDYIQLLEIIFKDSYYVKKLIYEKVPFSYFEELSLSKSFGKCYLELIKPNFKILNSQRMSDVKNIPTGVNNSKKESKRFIDIQINVSKINKSWLTLGKNGAVYLNAKLHMLPDGTVDTYENLGMITQNVPKEVWEKDKKAQGEILGNARENEWKKNDGEIPGVNSGESIGENKDVLDDLPF